MNQHLVAIAITINKSSDLPQNLVFKSFIRGITGVLDIGTETVKITDETSGNTEDTMQANRSTEDVLEGHVLIAVLVGKNDEIRLVQRSLTYNCSNLVASALTGTCRKRA